MTRHTARVLAAALAVPLAAWALLWVYLHVPPAAFFVWTGVTVVLAVLVIALLVLTGAEGGDPFALAPGTAAAADAEEHLAGLLKPGPAEATLTTDLRQRRMLLRPRGLSEHKASLLAARTARRALRLRGARAMAAGKPSPLPATEPAPAAVRHTHRKTPDRPAFTGEMRAVREPAHQDPPAAITDLPGTTDGAAPLYRDDTGWHDFAALKDQLAAEVPQ